MRFQESVAPTDFSPLEPQAGLFEVDEEKQPALVSEKGTQLVAKSFQKFLNTWKIEHRRTAVRHPESNGKTEVFHKTVKHERIYIQETYQTFYEAKKQHLLAIFGSSIPVD